VLRSKEQQISLNVLNYIKSKNLKKSMKVGL